MGEQNSFKIRTKNLERKGKEREMKVYIYLYVCFGIPKKLSLRHMNRLNSLKHMQHLDEHNSKQKKGKEKKKENKIFNLQLFGKCNMQNIRFMETFRLLP